MTLSWFFAVLHQGAQKELTLEDLGVISSQSSIALYARFDRAWSSVGASKYRIYRALFKGFKWDLVAPLLPSLLYPVTAMAVPLLLDDTLKFLGDLNEPMVSPA